MHRPAIDFVSPLPPVRSGIADYSLDLLPYLAERCRDLRIVSIPELPLDEEIAARWPVVGPERLGEDDRVVLYQMGNNVYHREIFSLASRHPGVLTLHDLVLHHFLIDRTVQHGDFDGYRRQMELDHGCVGELASLPMRWPGGSGSAAQFALPCHRTLLQRQRGVLTHSRWAERELLEELPGLRVRQLPMGIPLPPPSSSTEGTAFRRRHRLPLDRPILGSFGFQTPIKRTEVVIRALAEPELSSAHLMVAGEMAPILDLEGVARELGVLDRVHLLGFLPFEDFEAAIAACDICLNLRYPTAGETSASLLRILAIGKPAVISDHAQAEDLPDDVVIKVPLGDEEAPALARRVARCLEDPEALARLGSAARKHVAEQHRLEAAAGAIAEACGRWQHELPLLAPGTDPEAPELPLATSATWSSLEGELELYGAERPWAQGARRRLRVRLVNRSRARWLAAEREEGGVALEILLRPESGPTQSRWLRLPVDLEPGESHCFELDLRRPLGPARLRVLPHLLGGSGFSELGGPSWEGEL